VKKPYTSYNLYFLVPFLLWLVVGGIMLLMYDKQTLFTMVNTHYSSFTDVVMSAATQMGEASFITIVLLLLLSLSSLRNWWYFTTALIANVLPTVFTQLLKHWADAPRPLKYFNDAAWIHILPTWQRLTEHSFPSGHTCGAFGMYCLLSCLLKPAYKYVGIIFFCLAMLVAYSRMYLAAHFFADVYVGSIVGTAVSIVTLWLMRKAQPYFFRKQP